jgi:hypothetical protein
MLGAALQWVMRLTSQFAVWPQFQLSQLYWLAKMRRQNLPNWQTPLCQMIE